MAIYPIYNPVTGEKRVVEMSVHEITQWYKDNPPWSRDWGEGCASIGSEGEWKDKLNKSHPSWNEILKNAKKTGGMNSRVETL
ncbi:hypothetical protein b23_0382 [Synechococcus phage B23]|nr:hypothetical protein b23_0382 [Synechococcus phage B23]